MEVSATVFLNSTDPAQLFVRGRDLNSATPTYYAISVTRGLALQLTRVQDGQATVLSTGHSDGYLSGQWVQLSLRAAGDVLSVQVRRTDNGRYMTSSGEWVSQPVNAIQTADTGIASPGQVGLARGAVGNDKLLFDNFRVQQVVPDLRELLQAQRFDSTPTGRLPDGWLQWSSRPDGSAQVGWDQTLQLNGQSTTVTRAWLNRAMPADVQVSSSINVDGVAPTQVLARGQNLGTAAPSYYAASVSRGLNVQLLRVVNGQQTVLGQVQSRDYVSGQWIQVSLVAKGTDLRVQVFRTDTSQYLQANGTWGLAPAWALARTDAALTKGGLTGLVRGAGSANAVGVDNFIVTSPPARWDEGNPIPTRQDKPTNTPPPPTDPGSPPTLPPSTGGGGGTGTTPANPALPPVPRNLPWIRLAELAYYGTPLTDFEKNLLKNDVDLVIPNLAYLDEIAKISPDTPQFLYTNVSNIYLSLLTDWLAYADSHGIGRENAFYHVTEATPFAGASASSVAVAQFWSVFRNNADGTAVNATSAAHTPGATVALAGAGGSLNIGYTEKFREIDVGVRTAGAGGWAGRLEYVTAVDSQGRPTAWATLPLLQDGTAGFRRSGTVTFDPPSNWVAATLNGSDRLFYVRVRTTSSGGTAPVLSSLLSADYTNSRGGSGGTIPAFDATADKNHDGYLNDAEYAARKPGMNARFAYQSRLTYPNYGPNRFATDVSNAAFRAWVADYNARFMKSAPQATGVFVDNSSGKLDVDPASVQEALGSYAADYGSLLGSLNAQFSKSGRWLIANTGGAGTSTDPIIKNGVSYLQEFALRPMSSNYVQFEDLVASLAYDRKLSGGKAYEILDSLPTGGDPADPRTQLATLAQYYLLADPNLSFLLMNGGAEPSSGWARHWTDAIKYNVGKPTSAEYVYATGAGPGEPGARLQGVRAGVRQRAGAVQAAVVHEGDQRHDGRRHGHHDRPGRHVPAGAGGRHAGRADHADHPAERGGGGAGEGAVSHAGGTPAGAGLARERVTR